MASDLPSGLGYTHLPLGRTHLPLGTTHLPLGTTHLPWVLPMQPGFLISLLGFPHLVSIRLSAQDPSLPRPLHLARVLPIWFWPYICPVPVWDHLIRVTTTRPRSNTECTPT